MHPNCRKWLEDVSKQYPEFFNGAKVLELGAQNVNGTIRDYFTDCEYVGVDRVEGEGVDIVTDQTRFEREYFDTLAIVSVFEHDLEWKETLRHNLRWLRKGGMCFVCFGAEGNLPHMAVWQPVPHQEFLDYCKELGVEVLDSFFEEDRYGAGDPGVFDVVIRK